MDQIAIQAHFANLAVARQTSRLLATAIKLGLFEALTQRGLTITELASACQLNEEACGRLVAFLATQRYLATEDGVHSLTPLGQALTSQSPLDYRRWASGEQGPMATIWEFLPAALQTGEPQWSQMVGPAGGTNIFETVYQNPMALAGFCGFLNQFAMVAGNEMATKCKFGDTYRIVDIAGGLGGMLKSLLAHYPTCTGVLYEMPAVLPLAQAFLAEHGLSQRVELQPGDLFTGTYPPNGDVYILSWVLHDWNDEHCHDILTRCFAAMPPGKTLLISEGVLDDQGNGHPYIQGLALLMLLAQERGARERTLREYRELLVTVGFGDIQRIKCRGLRDIIVARKP